MRPGLGGGPGGKGALPDRVQAPGRGWGSGQQGRKQDGDGEGPPPPRLGAGRPLQHFCQVRKIMRKISIMASS